MITRTLCQEAAANSRGRCVAGAASPSCPPADPQLSTLLSTLQLKQDGTRCPTSRGCLGPRVRAGGFGWATCVRLELGGCM